MNRNRCLRLLPLPPFAIYEPVAMLERRAVERGRERQSRRIHKLGRDIIQRVESIGDERASA